MNCCKPVQVGTKKEHVVLVVTDLSVSLSSVGVLGEAFSSDSDCEIVKPQFSSFSGKRRRPKTRSSCQEEARKKWTVKSAEVGAAVYQSVARLGQQ